MFYPYPLPSTPGCRKDATELSEQMRSATPDHSPHRHEILSSFIKRKNSVPLCSLFFCTEGAEKKMENLKSPQLELDVE